MKTISTLEKINHLLTEQFAIDYGCTVEDFCSKETLVTELREEVQESALAPENAIPSISAIDEEEKENE